MNSSRMMMTSTAALMCLFAGTALRAQGAQAAKPAQIPVKVDVTLSRYQGDKKVSSMPFTLLVTAAKQMQGASLRVGVDVPVGTRTDIQNGGNQSSSTSTTRPDYRSIGTSIDCWAMTEDDNRYSVRVNLSDSAIFDPDAVRQASSESGAVSAKSTGPATFRTFNLNNSMDMRDGQTLEFATATDKITGEVLKMAVTLTVLK